MTAPQINRVSQTIILILSAIALVTVLTGYFQPPQPDEGAAAHIFQLSIVALVPTIFLFLVTAEWKQPARIIRPLIFPAATLIVSFGALYYLEHFR